MLLVVSQQQSLFNSNRYNILVYPLLITLRKGEYWLIKVKRYLRHYRRLASYRCQCWRVQTASHRKQEHDSMPTSPSTSSSSSSSSENISYQCDPRRFCCCSADSAHALDHLQVGDRVSPKTIGRCCTQCGRWICPQCLPKTPTNLELFCDKCK